MLTPSIHFPHSRRPATTNNEAKANGGGDETLRYGEIGKNLEKTNAGIVSFDMIQNNFGQEIQKKLSMQPKSCNFQKVSANFL